MRGLGAVLFDLDGTLLDTAPDMVGALNRLLLEESLPARPLADARRYVSNGARGLINMAFDNPGAPELETLIGRFLTHYENGLVGETGPFAGMNELLRRLESVQVPWGVVTNKPAYLTEPLMEALGLSQRAACIVSGDTITERKPHPGPVQHALAHLGQVTGASIYVGDSARDIQAGRSAGVYTAAAAWGYILPGDDPASWGADFLAESPEALIDWLQHLSGGANQAGGPG